MGAWGTGPFDNTSALEYLDELATAADAATVDADLTAWLAAVTRPVQDEEYRFGTCDRAYTSAGLVVAALTGGRVGPDDGQDPLDDGEYAALLDRPRALALAALAAAAVRCLHAERDWLRCSRGRLRTQLAALETALNAPHAHGTRPAA